MGIKVVKYIWAVFGLIISLTTTQGNQLSLPKIKLPLWTLVLHPHGKKDLPYRLRSSWDSIPQTFTTTGLSNLNLSGSAQFSVSQFSAYLHYMESLGVSPNQIVVVDLREEPHAFINGDAFTWYAKNAWWTQGNPVSLVLSMEKERLETLQLGQKIFLKRIDHKDKAGHIQAISDHEYNITTLQTEEEVVVATGAHYVRIPVTDHMRPEDKDVDQFLSLVARLPLQTRLYIHCHAGRGRTSTFMIMYDILRNPKVPLNAIIDRQVQLGSLDVRRLSNPLKSRKHPDEQFRFEFIKLFYEYVNASAGYGHVSWTKWIMERHKKLQSSSQ